MAGLVIEFNIEFMKKFRVNYVLFLDKINVNDGKICSTKAKYMTFDDNGEIILDEEPKYVQLQFKLLNDKIEKTED